MRHRDNYLVPPVMQRARKPNDRSLRSAQRRFIERAMMKRETPGIYKEDLHSVFDEPTRVIAATKRRTLRGISNGGSTLTAPFHIHQSFWLDTITPRAREVGVCQPPWHQIYGNQGRERVRII